MRIAVAGRGNVGSGLADLWERAGHHVTRIGRDGGDVLDAEVVLVAVPGGAIADALDKLQGNHGQDSNRCHQTFMSLFVVLPIWEGRRRV